MPFPIPPYAFGNPAAMAPGGDPDATAIIAAIIAAGVTPSAGEQTAIRTFVSDLKAGSLWTPMTGMYGFVGGTAGTHAINWKTPGTFNITWGGTVTHDANGITGSADGFGATGVNVLNDCDENSLAFGVYSRTNSAIAGSDIGAVGTAGGGTFFQLFPKFTDNSGYFDNDLAARISVAVADSRGLFTSSRTAANSHIAYRNAANIVSTTTGPGVLTASESFAVLALMGAGAVPAQFSNRNLSFAFISTGLTGANMTALYAAVQALQTSLSRNV